MCIVRRETKLTKVEESFVAATGMLIRNPVSEVFKAFTDGSTITRFWFTESSGPLKPDARVTWTWGMYGVSDVITVTSYEPNAAVEFSWGGDQPTTVRWTFTALPGKGTFVEVVNSGFSGTDLEQARQAIDSTGGFTWVLAGAKAWLEHGIELNLVADRFPPEYGEHAS
jgi:uncharacterized protein YndB with AHSA1/START domain